MFVFVAVAAVMLGVLVAAPTGDGAAAESDERAGPAGGVAGADFGCMALGITGLLLENRDNTTYFCDFQGEKWTCSYGAGGDTVNCVLMDTEHSWTCAVFPGGGASDCSDEGDGSYGCFDAGGEVMCNDASGSRLDFRGCHSPHPDALECFTDAGRMICWVFPPSDNCAFMGELSLLWADADCNGVIASRDTQAVLRAVLAQNPLSQTEPCPDVGTVVTMAAEPGSTPLGLDQDTYFGCVNAGLGAMLLGALSGDYTCNYAGTGWGCDVDGFVVTCTSGLVTSTCTATDVDTAECTDNQGGSHSCSEDDGKLSCTTTSGSGLHFLDCEFGPADAIYACLAGPDQFVCPVTLNHYDCLLLPIMAEGWADADCDGQLKARDTQALLREVLAQAPLSQTEPCPDIGDGVAVLP
jgi:hypothetical protein